MKIKIILLNLLLIALFASCATRYQPYSDYNFIGAREGYSDFQIDENTFSISFRANEYTSAVTLYSYTLKRAAEVVNNHGFKYFEIISAQDKTTKETRSSVGENYCFVTTHDYPALTIHVKGHHTKPFENSYSVDHIIN